MRNVTELDCGIYFESFSAVGGRLEGKGPLRSGFDLLDEGELFGMKTFERAEGEMSRIALNLALSKKGIDHKELDLLVAGDLQNQCVASSGGLFSFGIPFIGLYGACSTCTEGLMVLSSLLSVSQSYTRGASVTSSHNCAAERQFRMPLEYGGQRTPSASWTSTAAGAFVLSKDKSNIRLSSFMPGRAVDGYVNDPSNMGAAMALAASDSILRFFDLHDPLSFDLLVTGDLGSVGSDILHDILKSKSRHGAYLNSIHSDCGLLIYDRDEYDVHAGGSGCGCSASVLSSYILPSIENGKFGKVLFLSTGALMSTSSVYQGEHIIGIAPAIVIERT